MTDTMPETGEADSDTTDASEPEEVFVPSTASLALETKKFVLQALLEKAQAVLPGRDVQPVLKNFLLEADASSGIVRVVATDLELSVVAETQMVNIKQGGTAVFPGKRLLDLIREAEDGDAIIDVKEGDAHIAIGRTVWDLKLMDGSDYPDLPRIEDVEIHNVDRGKFLGALHMVSYAAATDTVRPNLMMVSIAKGRMRAADGARFQQADLGQNFPLDIDIPIGAVGDLTKLLRSTDVSILGIGETDEHLVFRIAADTFIANKLTVAFPDIEAMLLKPALANDQKFYVDRADFISAIKRVRVTADPETSAIILNLSKGAIDVTSKDKFGNHASESLDAQWDGEDREVAVHHGYLIQLLENSDTKSCPFFLGTDTKTRKSPLMLRDDESGSIGVLNQTRIEFLS